MAPRKRNIVVGTVVLVALLALGWMILQFSSSTAASLFTKGLLVKINADRADGLGEGSAVTYLGVPVGKITRIRRVPSLNRVTMDAIINANEDLPANMIGLIKAQSALSSGAAVTLETRPGQAPSDQKLKEGDAIEAENKNTGFIPPEFTELARRAQEQQIIEHLDQTIRELQQQLKKAGQVMESFNGLVGDPKLRADLNATVASARAAGEDINRFSKRLDGLATAADDTLKQARTTLADGGKRVDELSKQMNDRLTQVGDVLDKFNAIAAKVEKGDGTLGRLVNDGKLYDSLVDTGKTLSLTAGDLRRLVQQWEEEGVALKLK